MNKKEIVKNSTKPTLEDLLLAFRRRIKESMKNDDVTYELTMSQFEALRVIGTEKAKTMKDIAEALTIAPPSATALIEEMQHKGLVKRSRDKNDRRIVLIDLTDKAQKLFTSVCEHKRAVMNRMLRKLTPKDKETLERIIGIIITH